jgi:hypothetical protein
MIKRLKPVAERCRRGKQKTRIEAGDRAMQDKRQAD